jgi:nifR3 family TIM-barrel protein
MVKPNMFDFNFCCPVEKIIGQGAGCALLKRPKKIGDIISCIRDATDLPVSAKIRLGINEGYSDFLKTAKVIEDSGADMLIVHGRYQDQKFSGEADWDAIRQIKEHVNIPVVGNGDIFNEHKAQEMLTQTGCDYIMVSRAAIGNPFIFSRINHFLDTGEILEQQNKFDLIEQYFELTRKSITNNSIIKNQLVSFTKTIDNSSDIRRQIMELSDVDECMSIIRANAAGRQ